MMAIGDIPNQTFIMWNYWMTEEAFTMKLLIN